MRANAEALDHHQWNAKPVGQCALKQTVRRSVRASGNGTSPPQQSRWRFQSARSPDLSEAYRRRFEPRANHRRQGNEPFHLMVLHRDLKRMRDSILNSVSIVQLSCAWWYD